MSHQRMSAAALLLVALLFPLSACSKSPAQTSAETRQNPPVGESAKGATTIRLLSFGLDPLVSELITAYQDKYPNDRVQKVGFDYSNAGPALIQEKVRAGEADLVTVWQVDLMTDAGLLLPLDPFIQQTGYDLKGFGSGFDSLRMGGKLYALPYTVSPQILVYNPAQFKEAGVPAPRAGWTWDQFRETAKRLTYGTGSGKVWGFSPWMPHDLVPSYMLQATGSGWGRPDAQQLEPLLRLYSTMVSTDQSMPPTEKRDWTSSDKGYTIPTRSDFLNGKAAMGTLSTMMLQRLLREGSQQWDVAPLPVMPGAREALQAQSMEMFGIASTTRAPDAAWRFLSFVAGPEGAAVVAKYGALPARRSPEVAQALLNGPYSPPPGTKRLFDVDLLYPPVADPYAGRTDAERTADTARAKALWMTMSGELTWEQALAQYKRETGQ